MPRFVSRIRKFRLDWSKADRYGTKQTSSTRDNRRGTGRVCMRLWSPRGPQTCDFFRHAAYGQASQTDLIENYPGFPEGIVGGQAL